MIVRAVMQKTKGFGLIEVLVAIAIVAGAALVVSQYITTQTKQMVQIREKTSCTNTVNSILSKLKEIDNNSAVANWLPKEGQGAPNYQDKYLQLRMNQMIFDAFKTAKDVEKSIITTSTSGSLDGPYTVAENNIRLGANNYQLIYSASNLLSYYYQTVPNICTGTELDRSKDDFLNSLTAEIDEDVKIFIKVNVLGAAPGSCESWEPIPQGVQSAASVKSGYEFEVSLNYTTKDNREETCKGNATFYTGANLIVPKLNPQLISVVNGFNELPPTDGRVLCGPNANPSITFNVAQETGSEQPGTQFVCRLDYEGKNATNNQVVYPFRSTGWFLCSLPEVAIGSLALPNNTQLTVTGISVSDNNAPAAVQFIVSNWVQGSYKFHVKAIDIAQNETIKSQKFYIDISRPKLQLTPPSQILAITDPSRQSILNASVTTSPNSGMLSASARSSLVTSITNELKNDLFQCLDQSVHRWDIDNVESLEVTPTTIIENYHPSLTPVAMVCDPSSQNIPASNWSDGPHMVQAISCDLCGGDASSAASATWYVDTVTNFVFTAPGNLSAASANTVRFNYNAGSNNSNPYVLTHEVYGNRGFSANRYSGNPIAFPFQSGMAGDCDSNRYGRYCYAAADGCGRLAASPSYQYQVGGGGGATYFCPTFSCAEPPISHTCPVARPYTCSCYNDSVNDLNQTAVRKGRYFGNPAEPGCQYEESLGSCCRPSKNCQLNDGTIIDHGSSIMAYSSNTVSCGQTCQPITRTCTDGVLSGANNYQNSTCSVNCCPAGMTGCSQASSACTVQLNGSLCMWPQSCGSGETECDCGSGNGCPITSGSNGLCCK